MRVLLNALLLVAGTGFALGAEFEVRPVPGGEVEIRVVPSKDGWFQVRHRASLDASSPWIHRDGPRKGKAGEVQVIRWRAPRDLPGFIDVVEGVADSDGDSVFDEARVAVVRLTVAEGLLPTLTNVVATTGQGLNADGEYVEANLDYDGTVLPRVGLRRKGNSSATMGTSTNALYKPFKIDFDRFVEGQKLKGLKKLNLHTTDAMGQSGLEDYLGYGAWREQGVPAPRTGWAEVWLNGSKLGLYTVVEQPGGKFLKRHYSNPNGNLYKPELPAGTLEWLGSDFGSYTNANWEEGTNGTHAAFLKFVDIINHKPVSEFRTVADVTGVLTYLAGNVALGNWDEYTSMGHNFFLYEAVPGRFTMFPWDMNLSMGLQTDVWRTSRLAGGQNEGATNGAGGMTNTIGGMTNFPGGMTNVVGGMTNFPGGMTNMVGGMTNLPPGMTNGMVGGIGGGIGGSSTNRPLADRLLADREHAVVYLHVLRSFLEGGGSESSLTARVDAVLPVLGARLDQAAVLQLRSNITQRVRALRSGLESAQLPSGTEGSR